MKTKTVLFVLSALCLTMSCSKDNPQNDLKEVIYDGHFECRGVHYETLQAAVDACVTSGDFPKITLVGNVKDNGAVIPDGIGDCFVLDLSAFKYVLNEGKCLNIGNNDAVLFGSGGGIEGNGVIIKSSGEDLSFGDNIIIKGDISASSDVCFEENFLGKFEGNLSLDGGTAYFSSVYSDIHIINLSTKGSDAGVQVYDAPKYGILIDNVDSDLQHPVCAMKEGLVEIKSGAAPHVHKFTKSEKVEGDCCTPGHHIISCPDCGYEYEDFSEDNDAYGPCNPKTLEYEAAKPATATEFGNIERWICPFCDKAYADKEGKTLLEDGGLLLPTGLLLDYDVQNYFGNALNDLYPQEENIVLSSTAAAVLAIAGVVLSVVGILETAGMSIPGLLPDTKWADLNQKLDAMMQKLKDIDLKLNTVINLISAAPAQKAINDRHQKLTVLAAHTSNAFNSISNIIKSSNTEEAKIKEIKKVVTWWANQQDEYGGKLGPITESLLHNYFDVAVYGPTTIPKCNEVGANTVFLWEHDSYDFRIMYDIKDLLITCCSAILDVLYISDIKEYPNEDLRKADFDRIKKEIYFKDKESGKEYGYIAELKRDLDRMVSRNDKVRRLNASFNIDFSNEIWWVDPYAWFLGNWKNTDVCRLPRYTDVAQVSKKTCNTVKNEKMFGVPFTTDMAKTIYKYYSRDEKIDLDFKKVMVDSAKFTPVNKPTYLYDYFNLDSYFVANNNDEEFGHFNGGDTSQPYYNIFYWRSYYGPGHDWLGLRTCLDKHGNPIQKTILPNCVIKANRVGYMKSLGDPPGKTFWTLKRADN